jgi:hypothetical protein
MYVYNLYVHSTNNTYKSKHLTMSAPECRPAKNSGSTNVGPAYVGPPIMSDLIMSAS